MWRQLSSRVLFKHPRIELIEDEVELPEGQKTTYLTFGAQDDSVTAICVREDSKILLQGEYSYPPNEVLLQFPGGKVEQGESEEDSIRRELIEEAGLAPESIQKIGWFYPDNRRSSRKMHVFVARELETVEKKGGDVEEDISSEWYTEREISKMIADGNIVNYSVLAAWAFYISQRPVDVESKATE